MKTHSNDFKNNIKTLGREIKVVITYGNITLEEELYSINLHYQADLLKSVMKELDVETSQDIAIDTVINLQIGILVNETYEMLNYGNFVVIKSEKQEDRNTYLLTCYDKMIYAMKENENMNIVYPTTIKSYITMIANKLGLNLALGNFNNENLQIPRELYVGLDYTYRDILDELAQATGSIICINSNDELEVRYPTTTNDIIDEEFLKDVNVNFGEMYGPINTVVLSRSGGSDKISLSYPENLPDEDKIALEIADNQIMNDNNRSDYLQGILDAVKGLTYSINDFNSTGVLYYDIYDLYNVEIGDNIYPCIMLNDEIEIKTGLKEIIYTDRPQESETDYSKTDKTDRRLNQTYLIVDKQNQQIDAVITQTTDMSNPNSIAYKQSVLTQRVDSLDSKIQEVADITTSAENYQASVFLENINQSEPIEIRIKPIGTSISYLYPRANLYPSDIQYLPDRQLLFTRTYEEGIQTLVEYIYYELPDDLLYYDSENYDEFYLNYDSQTCQVIKRCKYNADGTVGLLDGPLAIDYPYPQILLGDGNYRVNILGYDTGYIFVRLMASNIYTSQFATRAEVTSEIEQTAQSITSTVSATYETKQNANTNYSQLQQTANNISSVVSTKVGNNEVISKINQSSEAVTILANKLGLTANDIINLIAGNTINLTSKNIVISSNNFNVDKYGNMIIGGNETNPAFTCTDGENTTSVSPVGLYEEYYDGDWASITKGGFGCGSSNDEIVTITPYQLKHQYIYDSTQSGSANLRIGSDGRFHRATGSSKRWKKDITENIDENLNPNKLYNLKIKQFKYKDDYLDKKDVRYNKNIIGFIAEDVKDVYEIATEYDEDGNVEMWNSDVMIPAMLKLIQEQHSDIEQLQKEIKELKGEK